MTASESFDTTRPVTIRAKWLFPGNRPGWEDGWITTTAGRITALGRGQPNHVDLDLGDMAVLPGLVNPHIHLEFSDLTAPLGHPGMPFPSWIGEVVRWRAELPEAEALRRAAKSQAIQQGLRECHRTGTCALGEIASVPWDAALYGSTPLSLTLFHEFLGLTPSRRQLAWDAVPKEAIFQQGGGGQNVNSGRLRFALSPHAPYTVQLADVRRLAELAAIRQQPIAMHLAESPEEIQMLQDRAGPFVDLLSSLGAWSAEMFSAGDSASAYLEALLPAPRALIIHGNYLTKPQWEWLGARQQQYSVVYCPRTHDYFGHATYPLDAMLARNVSVLLGTDSRASNPDLSLWNEARFVAERHEQLSGEQLLTMVTSRAASALGIDEEVGTLEVGKRWTAIAVSATRLGTHDPLRDLIRGAASGPIPLWPADRLADIVTTGVDRSPL